MSQRVDGGVGLIAILSHNMLASIDVWSVNGALRQKKNLKSILNTFTEIMTIQKEILRLIQMTMKVTVKKLTLKRHFFILLLNGLQLLLDIFLQW